MRQQQNKSRFRTYIGEWNTFEKWWIIIFTIINLYLFFAWQDSIIGLIASLTGMLTVVLVAKGRISNYYFGIVNIIAYAYVAYHNQYYGEVMLNILYYLPTSIIGLVIWQRHRVSKTKKDTVQIAILKNKERIIWVVLSLVAIGLYGYILQVIHGSLPYVDSATTILSIVATILMIKRVVEQWILWIIVDVISIAMWVYRLSIGSTDITILIMWSAFLVNAVYGLVNWIKLYNKQRA